MPAIVLTTDYGTRDFYVGALKGVIASIAPQAPVIDITHEIEPQNILHGAFVLQQSWASFPPGTIHVVVVDPGVGTKRRIILGQYDGRFVVAPDNGLVTLLHREYQAQSMHVVENRRYALPVQSSTFHGRDIMAPVAAHLANGIAPHDVGGPTDLIEMLPVMHRAQMTDGRLTGEALHVDRFGTIVTNIHLDQLAAWDRVDVLVGDHVLGPIRRTFSDVAAGEPVALFGSGNYLELAINCGRAIERFGPVDNLRIELRPQR